MNSHTSQRPAQTAGCEAISMANRNVVYLCVWSGDGERARDLVSNRYPGIEIIEFSYRKLRASSLSERIGMLHDLRGRALVFYFQSLDELKYRQILECIHFLHRCRETVLCDSGTRWETMRTVDILRSAPEGLLTILLDLKTLIFWWCYLKLRLMQATPAPPGTGSGEPTIAYFIPSLESMGLSGGAISHIRGFLYGIKSTGRSCRVFSGTALAQDAFENEIVARGQAALTFSGKQPCFPIIWSLPVECKNISHSANPGAFLSAALCVLRLPGRSSRDD